MPVNPRKLVELTREFPEKTGTELLELAEKAWKDSLILKNEELLSLQKKLIENGFYKKEKDGEISVYHFSDIILDFDKLIAKIEIIKFNSDRTELPFMILHNVFSENLDTFDFEKLVEIRAQNFFYIKHNIKSLKYFVTSQNIFSESKVSKYV